MKLVVQRKYLSLFFFILGFVLLAFLIHKVGINETLETLKRLKGNAFWVMMVPFSWTALQAWAWYRVVRDGGHHVGFLTFLHAKIVGEAINNLTPFGVVGGDPYRAYLLHSKISGAASSASVLIDRTLHTSATFFLIGISLLLAWFRLDLSTPLRMGLLMAIIVLAFLIFLLILAQKFGIKKTLNPILKFLRFSEHRRHTFTGKFAAIDEHLHHFYRRHPIHFLEVFTAHFVSRLLGIVEIYLIAKFLHHPLSLEKSMFLASLTVLINMVFSFVPGSIGFLEGGYGAFYLVLHADPHIGVGIQLVRRVRTLAWTLIGVIFMGKRR